MFLHRLGPALVVKTIDDVACASHASAEQTILRGQDRIPRSLDNALVNRLIEPEVLGQLAAQIVSVHLIMQRPDFRDEVIAGARGRKLSGEALNGAHDFERVAKIFFA